MEIAGFRSKYSDEQIEALLDAAANGGGGGSELEYLDIRGNAGVMELLAGFAYAIRAPFEGSELICGGMMYGLLQIDPTTIEFIAVDMHAKFNIATLGGRVSLEELLNTVLIDFKETIDSLPRITKEQFFDPNFS